MTPKSPDYRDQHMRANRTGRDRDGVSSHDVWIMCPRPKYGQCEDEKNLCPCQDMNPGIILNVETKNK
jgi:hypothetical protein